MKTAAHGPCGVGRVNKWLFNEDTVDKVLEHLMTRGQTVAAAIDSARRSSSPRTSARRVHRKRFDANYPRFKAPSRVSSTAICRTRRPHRRLLGRGEGAHIASPSTCSTPGSTCARW